MGDGWRLIDNLPLQATQLRKLGRALDMRLSGLPIAYIVGSKQFYGRDFSLTPGAVLVPRPDTEVLIEMLRSLNPKPSDKIIDIGTGAGIIAITVALEWPKTTVLATDISKKALKVAQKNAIALKAKVVFVQSDLLAGAPNPPYNFVIANLPYVDIKWQVSPETRYEPNVALFAKDGGLALIKKLIKQVGRVLISGGYLLLEADPRLHDAIITFARQYGLMFVDQQDFGLVLKLA